MPRDLGGQANLGLNNVVPGQWAGMIKPGNIDLTKRPVVHNPDGTISTVRSITISTPAGAVLIPTVIGNRVVSDHEAVHHFVLSGQHLGIFRSEREADAYAQHLHESQARQYAS